MAVAAAALVPVSPAGAAPVWSIAPSGNAPGTPSGSLAKVACPSATTCYALGGYGTGDATVTMMQQWDGSKWTIASAAPLRGPVNSSGPYLSDLECVSETFCVLVGQYQFAGGDSHPLAERWDGSAWAVMPSPDLDGVFFTSVSCPSETSCFASAAGGPYPQQTLVEHWDGNAWSVMSTPNVAGTDNGFLGIACATPALCFAVGSAGNGPVTSRTLVEQWDGTSWKIVASPNPSGTNPFPYLTDVACPSAAACYATGSYAQGRTSKTIVERWDGAKWSMVTIPDVEGDATLACPTATDCFAVGPSRKDSKGVLEGVALRGGAGSWSTVDLAANGPKTGVSSDVACASPSTCFMVGYNRSKNPVTIEKWNGTVWTNLTVSQPVLPDSTLSDVASAGTVCFTVGHSSAPLGSPTKTLILRRTPSGWNVVNSPNPKNGRQITLTGVSCPTTTLCFAVGTSDGKTLIERWNGKAWSVVPSPNNPEWGGRLSDVSCAGAKFCFAVGSISGESIDTLTERWDGTAWKIVPSPSRHPTPRFQEAGINFLQGVSCVSATSCLAVGNDTGYLSNYTETLAEHWNGSKWAIVKSPNPATYSNLAAVSCVSAKNCYAVGSAAPSGSTGTMQTLIAHWNGSVWTLATSADPTTAPRNALLGVSCPSATSCVAVGDSRNDTVDHTLVKRLTGATWSIEPSPDPAGALQSSLQGVGCTSATACVAVGYSTAPRTLVEQYG